MTRSRSLAVSAAIVLAVPLLASLAFAFGLKDYKVGSVDSPMAWWTLPAGALSAVLWGVLAFRSNHPLQRIGTVGSMVLTVVAMVWLFGKGIVPFLLIS